MEGQFTPLRHRFLMYFVHTECMQDNLYTQFETLEDQGTRYTAFSFRHCGV
jgi:hypothetical protein